MSAFNGFFDGVGEGGNFLPIVKFDARSGRITRRDRENGESHDVDITRSFKAIFDMENIEIGWLAFPAGGAPQSFLARLSDGTPPEKPAGEGFKRGVRITLKLSKECGGDVRELMANSAVFLDGAKSLMDAYTSGVKENAGKLPVVELKDTVAKTSTGGAMKSTNYVPIWEITGWVKRPEDLVYKSRNATSSSSASIPETGSTKVSAPSASEDDFG